MDQHNNNYNFFAQLAVKMFYILRDKVCKTNKYSELILDSVNYIGTQYAYVYGFSNETNQVTIFLGNITRIYDELPEHIKEYFMWRKVDYTASLMLYCIIHELFHMDQIRYNRDNLVNMETAYEFYVEKSADSMAIQFIEANYDYFENEFDLSFIDEAIPRIINGYVDKDPFIYQYQRLTLETLIKQFLYVSILRCYYLEGYDIIADLIKDGARNIIFKIIIASIDVNMDFCIYENENFTDKDLYMMYRFINEYLGPYEHVIGDFNITKGEDETAIIVINIDDLGTFEPLINW